MAKKKNPATMNKQDEKMWKDLGLDNFDGGFENYSFDDEFQENKESRTPTLHLASRIGGSLFKVGKSVVGGAAKSISSKVLQSLPETESIVSSTDDVLNDLEELRDKTRESARPFMNTMARVGRKMLGQASNVVPTSIEEKLQAKLKELEEATEEYRGIDEKEEKRLAREKLSAQILAEVFNSQAEERIEDKKTAAVKEAIDSKLTTARFNKNIEVLDDIRSNSYFQTSFLRTTMASYMKKDLELKYKQFYLAEDTLGTLVNMAKMQEERLDAIIHNSSLPDSQKVYMTEIIKRQMKEKTLGNISTKLSDIISSSIKGLFDNTIKPFLDSSAQALNAVGLASDLTSAMGGGGVKDTAIAGGMDLLTSVESNRIWNKVMNGKVTESEFKDIDRAAKLLKRYTKRQLRDLYDGKDDTIIHKLPGGEALADAIRHKLPDIYNRRTVVETKDLNQYNEASNLTNRTIETIEDIIPGYLAKMNAHLETIATGKPAEERIWDTQRKDFVTMSAATAKINKAMFGDSASQNLTALQSIAKLRAMNDRADYLYNGELGRRFAEDHVLQKNVYLLACNLANSTNIHEIDRNAVNALGIIAGMRDAGAFNDYVTNFAADAFGYNIHDEAKVQTAAFLYSTFVYKDGSLNNTTIGEFNDLIDDLATQYASGRAQAASFSKLGFGRVLNNFGTRDIRGNLNVGGDASLRHINRHVNADNIASATSDIEDTYIRVLDINHRESDYDMSDPRSNRFLKRRDSLTPQQIKQIEKKNEYIRKQWAKADAVDTSSKSIGDKLKHPFKTVLNARNFYEDKLADVLASVLSKVSNSASSMSAFGIKGKTSKADAVRSILDDRRGRTLFGIDTTDDYSFGFKELKGLNSGAIEEFRNRMLANNPSLKFLRAIDDNAWKLIKQEIDSANERINDLPKGKDKADRTAAIKRDADERINEIINNCVTDYTERLKSTDEIFGTATDKELRNRSGWYGAQLNANVDRLRESRHQLGLAQGIDDGFETETGIAQNSPTDSVAMQQLNSMLRIENILRAWRHLPQIAGVPGFTTGTSNLSYASIARTVGGANAPPSASGEALTANRRHEEVNETQIEQPEAPVEEQQYTEGIIGEDGFKTSGFAATPVNIFKRMMRFIPGKWGYNNRLKMNNSASFKEAKKLFRGLRDAEQGRSSISSGILGYRRPIDGSNNEGNYVVDMDEMPLRMDMGDGTPATPVLKDGKIYYINERLVALLIKQGLMASFDPETQVIIGDNDEKHLFNVLPGLKWFGNGDNNWRFRKTLGFNIDEKGKAEYVVRTAGKIYVVDKGSEEHERDKGGRIGIVKNKWSGFKTNVKNRVREIKDSIWHREATPEQLKQLKEWGHILIPRDADNLPIRDPETGKILEPYWDRDTGHNVCFVKWSDGKYHRELIDDVLKILELLKSRNGNRYENIEDAWEDYQWMVEHNESIDMFNTDKKRFVRSRTNFLQRMFKTKGAKQAEAEYNTEHDEEKQRLQQSEERRNERKDIDALVRKFLNDEITGEDRRNNTERLLVLQNVMKENGWTREEMNTDAGVRKLREAILEGLASKKREIRNAKEAKDTEANESVATAKRSIQTERRIGEEAKRLLAKLQKIDNDSDLSIEEREDALQDIIREWNENKDLASMDGPTRARILQKLNRTRTKLSEQINGINNDSSLSFTDRRAKISALLQENADESDAGAYGALISMFENRFGSSFNGENFSVSHEERSEVDTAIMDYVDIGSRQLELLGIINDNVATIVGLQGRPDRRKLKRMRRKGESPVQPRLTPRDDSGNVIRESEAAAVDPNEDRVSVDEKKNQIVDDFVSKYDMGSATFADVLRDKCLRAQGWNDPSVTTNEFIEKYTHDREYQKRFIAHARDAGFLPNVAFQDTDEYKTLEEEDRSNAEQKQREMLRRAHDAGEKFNTDQVLESGVKGTMKKAGIFFKADAEDTAEHVEQVGTTVRKSFRYLKDKFRDIRDFFAGSIDDLNEYDKPGNNESDNNNSSHMARGGVVIDANDNLRKYGGVVTEPTNIAGGRIQVGEAGAESIIPHRDNQRFKDLIINAVLDTMGEDKANAVANALSEDAPIKRMAQGGVFGKRADKQFDKLKGQEAILKEILKVLDESKGYMANMDTSLSGAFGTAVDATGKAITHGARAMGGLANGIMTTGGRAISGLGGLLSHIPIIGGLLGGVANLGGKAVSGAGSLMKLPWNLISGAGRAVSGIAGAAGGLLSGVTKLGAGLLGNGLKLGGKALAGLSKTGFGIMGLALKPFAWLFGGLFGGVGKKLDKIIKLMGGEKRKGSYEDFQEKRDKDGDGKPDAKEKEEEKKGILGKLLGGLGALFGFGKDKDKGKDKGSTENNGSGDSALSTAADAAIVADAGKGIFGKVGKWIAKPFSLLKKSFLGKAAGFLGRKAIFTAATLGVGTILSLGADFFAGWLNDRDNPKELAWKKALYKAYGCANNSDFDFAIKDLQHDTWEHLIATNFRLDPGWVQDRIAKFGYAIGFFTKEISLKHLKKSSMSDLISGYAAGNKRDDRKQRREYLKAWFENRFIPVFTAWAEIVSNYSSQKEGKRDATGYPDVNLIPTEMTSEAIESFNKAVAELTMSADKAGVRLNNASFIAWKKKHDEEELIKRANMSENERFEYDLQNRDLVNTSKYDFGWRDEWAETKTKFSESVSLWKERKYAQSIFKGLSGTAGAAVTGIKALFAGITSVKTETVSLFTGTGTFYTENENTRAWLEAKRKLYGFDNNEQLKYGKKDDIDKALDEFELDQRKIIDNERPPFDKKEFGKYITKFLNVAEILKMKDYFKEKYNLEVTQNLILRYFYTWYENVFAPVYFVYVTTLRTLGDVEAGNTPYPDDIPENMRSEGLKAFMQEGKKYLNSVNGVGLSVGGFVEWVEDGENRLALKDMSKVADKNRETLSSIYDENVKEAGATWDKAKTEWGSGPAGWGKALIHTGQAVGEAVWGGYNTYASWLGSLSATSRYWTWLPGAADRTIPDMVFDRRFGLYGIKGDPNDIRDDVEDLETAFRENLEGASREQKLPVIKALFKLSDELGITDRGFALYVADLMHRGKTDELGALRPDGSLSDKAWNFLASNDKGQGLSKDKKSRVDFVLYWFGVLFAPICERFIKVIREATNTGPNDNFDVTDIKIGDAHDPQDIYKICDDWWNQFYKSLDSLKNIHVDFSEAGLKEFIKGKEEYEAKKDTKEELSASAKAYADLMKSQKDTEIESAKKSVVESLGENAEALAGNESLMSSLKDLDNSTADLKKFKEERLTNADKFILELGGRLEDGTNLHGEDLLAKAFADAWGLTAINANFYTNYRVTILGLMKILVAYLWKDKHPEFSFNEMSRDKLAEQISEIVYTFLTSTGCISGVKGGEIVFKNSWWKNYFCEWFVRRVLCTFFYFASLYYKQTGAEIGSYIDITKLSTIDGIDADDIILYFSKKCKDIVGSYTYLIPNEQSWDRYRKRKGMYTSEELAAQTKKQQDMRAAWENNNKIIREATQAKPKGNAADTNTSSLAKAANVVQGNTSTIGSVAGLNIDEMHVDTASQVSTESPKKYANGGIIENLGGFVTEQTSILGGGGIAGEAGPEAIIPLTRPNRARYLLDKTAQLINSGIFNFKKFNTTITRFFKNPTGAIHELANRLSIDKMSSEDILRSMLGLQLTNLTYAMRGSLDGKRSVSRNYEPDLMNESPESMTGSDSGSTFMNWIDTGKKFISDVGSKALNTIKDFGGVFTSAGASHVSTPIPSYRSFGKVSLSGTSKSQLDLARKIWNYFLGKGWSEEGVAGMLGNLHAESLVSSYRTQGDMSSDLGPSIEYTKDRDANRNRFVTDNVGYGLAQWTLSTRKAELWDFTHYNNKSISDENCQIEFLNKELEGGIIGKKDLDAIKRSRNVAEACILFMMKFENPKDKSAKKQRERVEYAMQWYEQLKNSADSTRSFKSGVDLGTGSSVTQRAEDTIKSAGESIVNNAVGGDTGSYNSTASLGGGQQSTSAAGGISDSKGGSGSSGSGGSGSSGSGDAGSAAESLATAGAEAGAALSNANAGDLDKLIKKGGGKVNTSGLKPDFAKRLAAIAKEYLEQTGKKLVMTSAQRDDKYQAELWVRKNKFGDRGILAVNRPNKPQTIDYKGKKFDVPGGGPLNPHALGTAVDFSQSQNNLSVVASIAKKYGIYQPYPAKDKVHFQLAKDAKPTFDGTTDESTKESIKAVENTAKETIAQEKKAEEQTSIVSSTDAAKQLVTERMPATDTGVPTSDSGSGIQSVSSPAASFSTDTAVAGNVNNVDTNAEAQITEMRNSTDLLTQIRDILNAISKAEPAAAAVPEEPSKPVAMNGTNTDSITDAIRQGFSMILQDIKGGFNPASMMAANPSPVTQGSGQRSISSPVSFAKR